jgi:hypothetical protein
MMTPEKVGKPLFCHSGLDPESSHFNMFWIPPAFAGLWAGVRPGACRAGMTIIGLLTRASNMNYG